MTNSLKEPANLEIDALAKEVVMQGGNKDDRIDTLCNVMAQHFETVVGVPHGTAKEKATMIVLGISQNTSRQFVESEMQGAIQHWKAVDALRSQIKTYVFQLPNVLANTDHFNRIRDNMSIDMSNAHVTQVGNDASIITVGDSTPDTSFIINRDSSLFEDSSARSDFFLGIRNSRTDCSKVMKDHYTIQTLECKSKMPTRIGSIRRNEYKRKDIKYPLMTLFSTVQGIVQIMNKKRELAGLADSGPVTTQITARAGLKIIRHVLGTASISTEERDEDDNLRSVQGKHIEQACLATITANNPKFAPNIVGALPPLNLAAEGYIATRLSMTMGEFGKSVRTEPNAVINHITAWLTQDPDSNYDPISSPRIRYDQTIINEILNIGGIKCHNSVQEYARETGLLPTLRLQFEKIYNKDSKPKRLMFTSLIGLCLAKDKNSVPHIIREESVTGPSY